MMDKYCGIGKTLHVLLIIGGINVGLSALGTLIGSNLDILGMIFGQWPTVMSVFYLLVGLGGLHAAISQKKCCGGMCPMGK